MHATCYQYVYVSRASRSSLLETTSAWYSPSRSTKRAVTVLSLNAGSEYGGNEKMRRVMDAHALYLVRPVPLDRVNEWLNYCRCTVVPSNRAVMLGLFST